MASILLVADGFPSILYPSVELARRLAAAGHRVSFAARPATRGLFEHLGINFLSLDPSRYRQFLEADARVGTFERLMSFDRRRERATASMAVSEFARTVRDIAPDLVILDGEMHEHIIAASGAGVRLVLLNSFASIWRQPGLPPPHTRVRPGVGWKGTGLGISLLWLALRVRKWRKAWTHRARQIGCDRLSILHQLARDAGFDFRGETDDSQWLMPFTYRNLPVLSLHALEFEFPHHPPERVHYVGPMLLDARIDRSMPDEGRAKLDAIFEQRRHARGEHKLIYAGFGSTASTALAFLRRLVGIVSERRDWELVISLSDRIASAELGPLPDRVHAFPWVPQTQVLKHADVAVTHGGINTIDECVIHGVPMLIYCGLETDMAGNTERVVHHGLGIAGDRRRDNTPIIRGHIDRLLVELHFRANVKRMAQCYTAYVDNRVAERTVESLLGRDSDDATL